MNDDEYRRMRAAEEPEYESANGEDASAHTAPDETDEDALYDLGYPEEPQEEDAGPHDAGIVLGQIAAEEKSNEITAVPMLPEALDIGNCIVTADAMSCQKTITKAIISQHGDYVIGLQ